MSAMKLFSIFLCGILLLTLCAANNSRQPHSAEAFLKSEVLHKALLGPDWEAVIKSVPDSTVARDPRVMLLLGHASYGLGQNNAAAAIFTLISDSASLAHWEKWTNVFNTQNARSPVAHYLYGDALARNKKYDQSLKEFNETVRLNEKFCLALNARGAIYDIKGDLNKASDDFETATGCCPDFADTYANIGMVYLQRGFRGAGEQFEKAIERDPVHALAYNGKACYYASNGEIDSSLKAIVLADTFLKDNPYIVASAKAFVDSTDSTSAIARIANSKETNLRGLKFRAEVRDLSIKNFLKIPKLFDLHIGKASIGLDITNRGGVYFTIKEDQNLKIRDASNKQKVTTEFILGYPRIKK